MIFPAAVVVNVLNSLADGGSPGSLHKITSSSQIPPRIHFILTAVVSLELQQK